MEKFSVGLILVFCFVPARSFEKPCNVRARTESGWVCGLRRPSATGSLYASFRGVPYAKQPVGKLRFRELQPQEPWQGDYNAVDEGPICIQDLNIYGSLLQPQYGMSESCIHANIHVPLHALPHEDHEPHYKDDGNDKHKSLSSFPYNQTKQNNKNKGIPIIVFIHGGGYGTGSADADLHGPEYLVSKDVIVMLPNYRINVFGFLSLNTPSIPGNNGLRDVVTFLKWVQRNAKNFGGDPHDVTLMGNSVGANIAHLLTLSDAAKGLFNRVFLLSGQALPITFTSSPAYAANVASQFLYSLGISATDPEEIHKILTEIPIERIIEANSVIQPYFGILVFVPVVETKFPGVTTILDRKPQDLLAEGRGKEYPTVLGYCTSEAVFFAGVLDYGRYYQRIVANPRLVLPFELGFTLPSNVSLALGQRVMKRCFSGEPTLDEVVKCYSEISFVYPAYRVARIRAEVGGAPTFLYQFSYESEHSVIKAGLQTDYRGVSHVEDQTYILKANSILDDRPAFPPMNDDDMMRDWMTMFVINFIMCDNPSCNESGWPKVEKHHLIYENIERPYVYKPTDPTPLQHELIDFYDGIFNESEKYLKA